VLQAGVGFRVGGAEEMASEFLRLASDAEAREQIAARGAALIEAQRGAAQRCANVAVALVRESERV
jgi:hypothetical protein